MIPTEIPPEFRFLAVVPPGAAEHEVAWMPEDALAVLGSLESSRVVVQSALGYKLLGTTLIPTGDAWDFPPTSGETESSRAMKSRAGAASFIRALEPQGADYVSLEFSFQDEAA